MIGAGEFGFREGGVDFAVADLVEKYGRTALAAPELWDQVVMALPYACRNRALAGRGRWDRPRGEFAR